MKQKNTGSIVLSMLGGGLLVAPWFPLFGTSPAYQTPTDQAQTLAQLNSRVDEIEKSLTSLTKTFPNPVHRSNTTNRQIASTTGISRSEIARLLREKLQSVFATVEADRRIPYGAERVIADEIMNTPENIQAYNDAHDRVKSAQVRGRWTNDDADSLRGSIGFLTVEQQEEIFLTLIPAMNRGEIAVETTGPPF